MMATRTGQEYLEGLADDRDVRLGGGCVSDVRSDPVLASTCAAVAKFYDLQNDPSSRPTLTSVDDDAEVYPLALTMPRTVDDLVRRRAAYKLAADATFGMMGRSPDFVATAVTAFATAKDYFGEADPGFAENIERFWQYCREQDLFLAHATINPPTNRSAPSRHVRNHNTHLRITSRDPSGLRVSGAKLISTLAPVADELVVFPLPGYSAGDEAFTAAFAVPAATPGLRFVCRDSFGGALRPDRDHPLGRYDEMDAICIFDDVLVPADRVFFCGNVGLANRLYDATTARHHTGHHGITRALAKAELLVGIAIALAESAQTNKFLHVEQMLGEVIGMLELARGSVLAAEAGAVVSPWGGMTPAIEPIQAMRLHFPQMCARMLEVIQTIGAGSLLAAPSFDDLDDDGGEQVAALFATPDGSGRERVRLLKLAWDATGDAVGQRQQLYERYHSGDPVRLAAQLYRAYDGDALRSVVERAAGYPS
jgi:4-hydroxyphenylacetate 3-monooxygenase oxygenase component